MRLDKTLDGGYFNLASLMELYGYKDLKHFQDNYDVIFNLDQDDRIFFNAKKFAFGRKS